MLERERILDPMARQPFNFSLSMRSLCDDIVERVPEFSHVDMPRIAVCFAQTRLRVLHGLQAKLTPLRFEGGTIEMQRGRKRWAIPRHFSGDIELLYILTFYLPRFLDQTFEEKMITIFHELYHISPQFNGDIRRHAGRCHVHTESQKEYDRKMDVLSRRYLQTNPPQVLTSFLRHSFRELVSLHGGVVGLKLPIPRLVQVSDRQLG